MPAFCATLAAATTAASPPAVTAAFSTASPAVVRISASVPAAKVSSTVTVPPAFSFATPAAAAIPARSPSLTAVVPLSNRAWSTETPSTPPTVTASASST